ncbi:SIR2 family protein [Xanthomonas sp. WHRI 7065]|uniref:SIR2 family NAD-dependent protein deacylase n=1 Tax=Xanthomonas sp. WHRI 7065 TaxID=3161569 RepID=UPI0032E8ADBF
MAERVIDVSSLEDYPNLRKLAEAMWREANSYHGAAVMVGAGFGRSAAKTGDPNRKLPLWADLSKILASQLHTSPYGDPLRLAEEYEAYFGRQSLNDLLRREIDDQRWEPGDLYREILKLPWTEILTTNWDTLLERASMKVSSPVYSIVTRQEQLSSSRSPRIVKLHGTLGITDSLVFTQEDYRKFPQSGAAYVNFARQVFIENELCLVGFSGDDPNFLQWVGWVRDHLSNHVRRIYLVGALQLTSSKRKYLQSLNVAPIDLYPIVSGWDSQDRRHLEAIRIFLDELRRLKPIPAWEWKITSLNRSIYDEDEDKREREDASIPARRLKDQLEVLARNRKAYPGWLICPQGLRWQLSHQITDPNPSQAILSVMSVRDRSEMLYEISWRYEVSGIPIPTWLSVLILETCKADVRSGMSVKQLCEMALFVLRGSRWLDKNSREIVSEESQRFLEEKKEFWEEIPNELCYFKAENARDELDYVRLQDFTDKINPIDPIWQLRKAGLLCDLGRFEEAKDLVSSTFSQLQRQNRDDPGSILIFSRLAWAHWFLRGLEIYSPKIYEPFPSIYQDKRCSPWDEIQGLSEAATSMLEKERKKIGIEPLFDTGSFRDRAQQVTWSNEIHPLVFLELISNRTGLPMRSQGVSFLGEPAKAILQLKNIDDASRFSLVVRVAKNDSDEILNKVMSRTKVASLDSEYASSLLASSKLALEFWIERFNSNADAKGFYIEKIQLFLEFVARMCIRASPEEAMEIFKFSRRILSFPSLINYRTFRPFNNLVKFSLESINKFDGPILVEEALLFPVSTEYSAHSDFYLYNPVVEFPGSRVGNKIIDERILKLIDLASSNERDRGDVLERLLLLQDAGYLSEKEKSALAKVVWGDPEKYEPLPGSGLYWRALSRIPSANPIAVNAAIRRNLFSREPSQMCNAAGLVQILGARSSAEFYPTEAEACAFFDHLVKWRRVESDDLIARNFEGVDKTEELLANSLASVFIPALERENLTPSRFAALLDMNSQGQRGRFVAGLPYFATADPRLNDLVKREIRVALRSQDVKAFSSGTQAILIWIKKDSESLDAASLLSSLVSLVEAGVPARLPALLGVFRETIRTGNVDPSDVQRIADVLPELYHGNRYEILDDASYEAVVAPLVRRECVRIADLLLKNNCEHDVLLSELIRKAASDPLPEVRYALD